jgi:hypothetical protein
MCSHCLFPACYALLATCYKVVEFNRLVTSCSNNLLSSCNSTIQLDEITALLYNFLTSLQQGCCEHILLTSCKIFMCVREKTRVSGENMRSHITESKFYSVMHIAGNDFHASTTAPTALILVVVYSYLG